MKNAYENVLVKRTEFNQILQEHVVDEVTMQRKQYLDIINSPEYLRNLNNKAIACPLKLELIEKKVSKTKEAKE